MANRGPVDVRVDFDNVAGTPVNVTAFVMSLGDLAIEALTQETTPFGTAWQTNNAVGVKKVSPIQLSGLFEDTATTGPDAIFNDPGSPAGTRTLKITWGGTKTSSVETIISKYTRKPTRNQLTMYTMDLLPTGAVTEV